MSKLAVSLSKPDDVRVQQRVDYTRTYSVELEQLDGSILDCTVTVPWYTDDEHEDSFYSSDDIEIDAALTEEEEKAIRDKVMAAMEKDLIDDEA